MQQTKNSVEVTQSKENISTSAASLAHDSSTICQLPNKLSSSCPILPPLFIFPPSRSTSSTDLLNQLQNELIVIDDKVIISRTFLAISLAAEIVQNIVAGKS